jgi:hypothetical protein
MIGKHRWVWIGSALMILAAGLLIVAAASAGSRGQAARARYDQIRRGMRPSEVQRLLQAAGTIMVTDIANAEVLHIDGRFMVAVFYEPDPLLPPPADPSGPPDDGWVANRKIFVELGRGDPLDNLMVGLGLRTSRVIAGERMP